MPEVKSVIKCDLLPDKDASAILDRHSRICNWLYNHLLELSFDLRKRYCETQNPKISKILYSKRGLRNQIPGLKVKNPFLKQVHSSPLKNTALRLSDSIQTYQKSRKGKRKGKKTGWPRFRSWKVRWFSLFYDEPNKGFKILPHGLQISLGKSEEGKSRLVYIPMPDANLLKDKLILNFRLVKQCGQFKAVFTVTHSIPDEKPLSKVIVLDPNHKNLAYGVDLSGIGIEIESPWWLKHKDVQIDKITAKLSRCQRQSKKIDVLDSKGVPTGKYYWDPSRRYKKLMMTKEALLSKRREQVKTYLYTVSNALCRRYDVIACGNYVPHGNGVSTPMRRAMNNRSTIGHFKEIVSWVAMKSGKYYLEFDEKGTTRTCHACLHVLKESLCPSIREWICPQCQRRHIRDENAAINGISRVLGDLEQKGKAKALSVPSSGPVSIKERRAWRIQPSGVHCRSRGLGGEHCSQRQEIKTNT